MIITVPDLNHLPQAAQQLLANAGRNKVFLFFGEMGAGKTTLIKAICEALGVETAVSSPTFSLVNEYEYPEGLIYHFDCYRLKSPTEALDFGIEEYLYSGEYCLVEWPEKIEGLWPEAYVKVSVKVDDGGNRQITIEHQGDS